MQISPKNRRRAAVAGVLVTLTVPSFALFGLGDIVFDPSAYAQAVLNYSQQVTAIAKLEAQLQTMYNTYTTLQRSYATATNTYDSIHASAQHYMSKGSWQTLVTSSLKTANVNNQFGETDGFTDALNRVSSVASDLAWKRSGVRMSTNMPAYLAGQTAGNSQALTQLAMVEASDAVSPACLSAVGAYHDGRAQNSVAQADLQGQQLDETDASNSEVEQLNLLNASEAQRMNEVQAQGALHSCIAAQMTVANMQQRNAAAADLNTWATVKQHQATNPTFAGNGSDTNAFLP